MYSIKITGSVHNRYHCGRHNYSCDYVLYHLRLGAVTFCRMQCNQCSDMKQGHCHEGLDKELMCEVSFQKDVLHIT